jgi:predicted phosphodiesterase
MRIAVVSDIHGNRTAFEAVLADLKLTSPDLIFHGGDLASSGSSPVEVVDRIRELGWPGVVGNTDEMLYAPESLTAYADQTPAMQPFLAPIQAIAAATRDALGEGRLAWLRSLPHKQTHGNIAIVHASPDSCWRAPDHEAPDAELASVFAPLAKPVAVYAHIHHGFIRRLSNMTVANTGSVSLSYDGDRRASYIVLDDSAPTIRRVEYDADRECAALSACGFPHADWIAKSLKSARPQSP